MALSTISCNQSDQQGASRKAPAPANDRDDQDGQEPDDQNADDQDDDNSEFEEDSGTSNLPTGNNEVVDNGQGSSPGNSNSNSNGSSPSSNQGSGQGEVYTGKIFGGKTIDLSKGRDMGHTPKKSGAGDSVDPSLTDATQAAGLGQATNRGNGHGTANGFVDVNGDDYADIILIGGSPIGSNTNAGSKLYINQKDGTFTDATASSGVGAALANADGFGFAAGDIDNDGDIDMYVAARPKDVLLINNGGKFTDGTAAANAGGPAYRQVNEGSGRGKLVAIGDYNGDGHMDIVGSSLVMAAPYMYLLENDGTGKFKDVTVQSRIKAPAGGSANALMWSDYDNDGDLDIWIWVDRMASGRGLAGYLLKNNKGVFTAIDVGVPLNNAMGIDGADFDHDMDLDYYVANITQGLAVGAAPHAFLRNDGNDKFTNISSETGTTGVYGWGIGFRDFNQDSWVDLFVSNEDNNPDFVYKNQTGKTFKKINVTHGPVNNNGDAHEVPASFADYDHDGMVDVLRSTTDGSRITLYKNSTSTKNHWLTVTVAKAPQTNNGGGITARVAVKTGDLVQFQDIVGSASTAAQSELAVHFGLGAWDGAEWVAVVWPDGRQIVVRNVKGDQRLRL